MMTIFLGFIFLGSLLTSVGVANLSFWVLIMGRIVYGIGGDSLLVVQWAYITEFFGEDQIGLASVKFFKKKIVVKINNREFCTCLQE